MSLVRDLEALGQYQELLGDSQCNFLAKLWTLQDEMAPTDFRWEPLSKHEIYRLTRANTPLLSKAKDKIDLIAFVEAFNNILALYTEEIFSSELSAKLQALDSLGEHDLDQALFDDVKILERVFSKQAFLDDDAKSCLTLVVYSTLRVFRAAYASQIKEIDFGEYDFPDTHTCPVCGAEASLSIINRPIAFNGGLRNHYCSSCDTQWHYTRIKCAFCGESGQERLRYFYTPDDEAHRVHACKSCKGIMAAINLKFFTLKFSPRVEELVSLLKAREIFQDASIDKFLSDSSIK